jgi:hypothetical protein
MFHQIKFCYSIQNPYYFQTCTTCKLFSISCSCTQVNRLKSCRLSNASTPLLYTLFTTLLAGLLRDWVSIPGKDKRRFSILRVQIGSGTTSLPLELTCRSVKLNIHLHLMTRWETHTENPPHFHTFFIAWLIKHKGVFTSSYFLTSCLTLF